MARNTASSLGGIVGGVFGLLIVGGLAATPFYLSMLQSNERGLDAAVEAEVQHLRRVVLHLDTHLSAISDFYAMLGEDNSPTAEEINEFLSELSDEDKEQLDAALQLKDLNRTAANLTQIEKIDQERGTVIESTGGIQRGKPDLKTAAAQMRQRLLKEHGKLIQEAQQSISKIRSADQSFGNAADHLGVARAAALLYFAEGRIARNQAEFEQMQAGLLQRQAAGLVDVVSELRRAAEVARVKIPDDVIAGIQERAAEKEKNITRLKGAASELTAVIQTMNDRIEELETVASEARTKLVALESADAPIYAADSEYAALSQTARDAEAEIDVLRDGSLSGATLAGEDIDDVLSRHYEGGEVQHGLETFKARLAMLEEQIAGQQAMKKEFEVQRQQLLHEKASLNSEALSCDSAADDRLTVINEMMAEAEDHLTQAKKAVEQAIQAFSKAGSFADSAALIASRKRSGAREQEADAKGLEAERLMMISSDGETELFLQCLSADIAYSSGLVLAQQIGALELGHSIKRHIAEMAAEDPPASIESECVEMREQAIQSLVKVSRYYTKAGECRGYTRSPGIQAKNLAWQLKIGEAAGLLLMSTLESGADRRSQAREAAYDLLVAAAKGHEQSPLLSPAIETIRQLQSSQ